MTISRTAALVAVMALLWTFDGAAREARGQPGGTPALESAEATLELTRSERRRIQLGLAAAGFDPGPADGLFGRATRGAIRKWQASLGQAATGYLDADAAKALLAAGKRREATTASKPKPPTPPTGGGAEPGSGILRDKYVLGLGQALKADDYPKALEFIDRIEKLGGDLPPALDYFRGESYFHTKRYDEAQRALNRYVKKTGKKGRYYRKSLELILAGEENAEAERLAKEARAKAKAEARKRQKAAFRKEIRRLVDLLRAPYSGSGTATTTIHGRYTVRYRYRYRIQVKQLSPVSIRLVSTPDVRGGVYSEAGKYTTSGGYTYTVGANGIFSRREFRRRWPEYFKPVVNFAEDFSFAKFGRAPCTVQRRSSSCPSGRPYLMHLNGVAIIHRKHHINNIYRKLVLIRSLKKRGYLK